MKRLKIIFSDHVLYQIKERRISITKVRQVINHPDKTIFQPDNRFLAYKLFKKPTKNYLLIVVYERQAQTFTIITTFLTSKLHKYL